MKRIVPHSPQWKHWFAREAASLKADLGPAVRAIHHIGSTAVVGLVAKPIIDIAIEASALCDIDNAEWALMARGYEPRGEYGIEGRRYFNRPACGEVPGIHLHAFAEGAPAVRAHLAFRDYLRAVPAAACDYAALKARLGDADGVLVPAYQDAKSAWVTATTEKALRHFADGR